jgi:hypothetical protein
MGYKAEQRGGICAKRKPRNPSAFVRMEGRGMRNQGKNNGFYGKSHTEETKQRMSEAAKQRPARGRPGSYKMLISAVIKQAAKDNAVWFFETETGRNYCAAVGFNPNNLKRGQA